jgi:hypothetical protein
MGGAAILFPMSFYAKGLEGHIDNPDAGWKGRGVWTPRGPVGPPDQPTAALVNCTVTFGAANRI